MLGIPTVEEALHLRPAAMSSVSPEAWELLNKAYRGGRYHDAFTSAWENGATFLVSRDGLRNRVPVRIEWKGAHRAPGDEVAPIELRVDHVYLVSCKYLSRVLINSSPHHLIDRLLAGTHGTRSADWYAGIAPREYQALYESTRDALDLDDMPPLVIDLQREHRVLLKERLTGPLPPEVASARAWP